MAALIPYGRLVSNYLKADGDLPKLFGNNRGERTYPGSNCQREIKRHLKNVLHEVAIHLGPVVYLGSEQLHHAIGMR